MTLLASAQAQHLLVILGSSTSAGTGATNYDSAYAGRYAKYLATLPAGWSQTNLAVGGYTSYQLMRTGNVPLAGRAVPDTAHNVTKALSLRPDVILLALGSNDIGNAYAASEYQNNYDSIRAVAVRAGVRVWITTGMPRNMDSTGRRKILNFRTWILSRYAPRAIDFFDTLGLADGSFNPNYNSGDGIHTNDRGHLSLYYRVVRANLTDLSTGLLAGIRPGSRGFRGGLVWDPRTRILSLGVAGSFARFDIQGRIRYGGL